MVLHTGASSASTTEGSSEAASGRRLSLRLPKLRLPATDESQRQTEEVNKNLEARVPRPVRRAVEMLTLIGLHRLPRLQTAQRRTTHLITTYSPPQLAADHYVGQVHARRENHVTHCFPNAHLAFCVKLTSESFWYGSHLQCEQTLRTLDTLAHR